MFNCIIGTLGLRFMIAYANYMLHVLVSLFSLDCGVISGSQMGFTITFKGCKC